ncbi:hypothetical protein [Glycomyces salinus]|uniref:hypothetical protein n=1 Tax=Glycomyces salinus TaxID=980294 RepID=UPI0018EACE31|nr:hypothetical protein [Glycomyces salinus]
MPDSDNPIKPLQKTHVLITRLTIVDANGEAVSNPFKLQVGEVLFKCRATYVDGSEAYYDPYWNCQIAVGSGEPQPWAVFGRRRRSEVTVRASQQQEQYSELACWVFAPDDNRAGEIVSDGIAFDYSLVK